MASTCEVRSAQGDDRRPKVSKDKKEPAGEAKEPKVPETDEVKMAKAIEKLRKRYNSIRKSWSQTDNDELLRRYLSSMTTGFDPHSDTCRPARSTTSTSRWSRARRHRRFAPQRRRLHDGQQHHPGGAADKDGKLKTGDKIVGVGQGADGAMEDIVDMKLNDVVEKIRGKRKTVVRLEVDPATSRAARHSRSPAIASNSKIAKPAAKSFLGAKSPMASRSRSA